MQDNIQDKELYFIRHGQTEWNAIKKMQGQWNSDLNELGRQQAEINGQMLVNRNIDAVFASPLDRTRQTAEIIQLYLDLVPIYDDRLKEWDCGDWSGYLYADIAEKWPQQWQDLMADQYHYRCPNGENYPDMIARSQPFLQELKQHPGKSIAIISHGLIGRIMISQLMSYQKPEYLTFTQPNEVVYRVCFKAGRPMLDHFDAGQGPLKGVINTQIVA